MRRASSSAGRDVQIEPRKTIADGAAGDIDSEAELWGEVFEPLEDPEVFRRFRLDEELNTITWPSGADLAPTRLPR